MIASPTNTIEQARKAKQRVKFLIENLPELATVGIAHNDSGYSVKVYLSQPVPENYNIPSTVEGITVEIEIVGTSRV